MDYPDSNGSVPALRLVCCSALFTGGNHSLSLITLHHATLVRAHSHHAHTHTYCQPMYPVCLHGWKTKVIKWMGWFMDPVDWCMLHCCARKVLNCFCLTVTLLLHLLSNRLAVFESKSDIGAPSMMKSFHVRLSGKPYFQRRVDCKFFRVVLLSFRKHGSLSKVSQQI